MIRDYQVTLIDIQNRYKPVSCIIKFDAEGQTLSASDQKKLLHEGMKKICQKRYWTSADLKRYGYTQGKIRLYDKEKIEKENAEKYWEIKKQKFAEGTWKPSKADQRKLMLEEIRKKAE